MSKALDFEPWLQRLRRRCWASTIMGVLVVALMVFVAASLRDAVLFAQVYAFIAGTLPWLCLAAGLWAAAWWLVLISTYMHGEWWLERWARSQGIDVR